MAWDPPLLLALKPPVLLCSPYTTLPITIQPSTKWVLTPHPSPKGWTWVWVSLASSEFQTSNVIILTIKTISEKLRMKTSSEKSKRVAR
jgi:hypothetical protein